SELVELREDLPDGPVELHDDVAVQAPLAPSLEVIRSRDRNMRHRVREVEKEPVLLVSRDEIQGPLRIAFGQLREVRAVLDDVFVLEEGEGRHVIAIGEAEVLVETLPRRQAAPSVEQSR